MEVMLGGRTGVSKGRERKVLTERRIRLDSQFGATLERVLDAGLEVQVYLVATRCFDAFGIED